MAASVEGTFRILDRASGPLDKIYRAAERTDRKLDATGRTMDKFAEKTQRDMRVAEEGMGKFARKTEQTTGKVAASMESMSRSVAHSTSAAQRDIASLEASMTSLDAMKASPSVDIDISKAMAQLAILGREIDAINAKSINVGAKAGGSAVARAVAPTSQKGGFLRQFGRAMKQQFISSAQQQVSQGVTRGVERLFTRKQEVASPAPEVIEDTGYALRKATGEVGMFQRAWEVLTGRMAVRMGVLMAVAPVLESIAAAASGLIGTLGAGTLAAGVGLTGLLGTATVGLGGFLAAMIPVKTEISEAKDAMDKYREVVDQYGRASKEAAKAHKEMLDTTTGRGRRIAHAGHVFSERFKERTSLGRAHVAAGIRQGLARGEREFGPQLATLTNQGAAGMHIAELEALRVLDTPMVHKGLNILGDTFKDMSPQLGRILANAARFMINVAAAARPQVIEFVEWLDKWMSGTARSTSNMDKMHRYFKDWTRDFKAWVGFFKELGKLALVFFGAGRQQGRGLLHDATAGIREQRMDWQRDPSGLQDWYKRQTDNFEKIVALLLDVSVQLGKLVDMLSRTIGPLADVNKMIQGAVPGNTILDSVASLAIGGGAYGLFRGGVRRAGTAAGTRLGGAMGRRGIPGAEKVYNWGLRRGGMEMVGPGGKPIPAGQMDFAQTPGGRAAMRGAGEAGTAGLARGGVRALGKVSKYAAPILIGADIASGEDPYTATDKWGAFGLLPGGSKSIFNWESPDPQRPQARRALARRGITMRQATGLMNQSRRRGGWGADDPSWESLVENASQTYGRRAYGRGARTVGGLGGAMSVYEGAGMGGQKAFGRTARMGMGALELKDMKQMGPQGSHVIAQNFVSWARAASKGRPKLREEYKRTVEQIERRFEKLGQNIEIINGRIYTGSKREWRNISAAMSGPMEQARQEVSKAMTQIQQQAIGSLMGMGYNRTQAKNIVQSMEKGGQAGQVARMDAASGPTGSGQRRSVSDKNMAAGHFGGARGMRLPGARGMSDTVPVAGGYGAPGELLINRHTELEHDRDAMRYGLPTMSQRVGLQTKRHADPINRYDRGGRIPDAMGALPGLDALAWIVGKRFGLNVISGMRPGAVTTSGNPSDHGWGGAVDLSNGITTPQMDKAHRWLSKMGGFAPRAGVTEGGPIKQMLYKTMIGGDHFNHIHVALEQAYAHNAQKVLAWLGSGGGGARRRGGRARGGAAAQVNLQAPHSAQGGAPGAMADAAMGAMTAGAQSRINRRLRRSGGAAGGAAGAVGSGRGLMQRISRQRGWNFADWWALDAAETSHGANLANPTSTARLRGQFLDMNYGKYGPGSDPAQNPSMGQQIVSMGNYIAERYGNPSKAWGFHQANNYYSSGGRIADGGWHRRGGRFSVDRPTIFGAGESGREEVSIKPVGRKTAGSGGRRPLIHIERIEYHGKGDIKKAVEQELAQAAAALDQYIDGEDELG